MVSNDQELMQSDLKSHPGNQSGYYLYLYIHADIVQK